MPCLQDSLAIVPYEPTDPPQFPRIESEVAGKHQRFAPELTLPVVSFNVDVRRLSAVETHEIDSIRSEESAYTRHERDPNRALRGASAVAGCASRWLGDRVLSK